MARNNQNDVNIGVNLTPNQASLKDAEAEIRELGLKFNQMLSLRAVVDTTPLRSAQRAAGAIGRRMLNIEKTIADFRKKSNDASQRESEQSKKASDLVLKRDKARQSLQDKMTSLNEKYGDNLSDTDAKRRDDEISSIKKEHDKKMSLIDAENARINKGVESSQRDRLRYEEMIKKKQEELQLLKPAASKALQEVDKRKREAPMSAADIVVANESIRRQQQRMAKKIKGMGITKTESEAIELSRRKIKLIKQETQFGKKLEVLTKRGFKDRRRDYLERNREITEKFREARKTGRLTFIGSLLGEAREKKQLRKETGAVSVGGAIGGIGGTAGEAITGGLGRLAGPLLALTTLASAVKMFLDVDEQIKNANKSMYSFAATGKMAWETISKGTSTSIGQLTDWTMSFNRIFDETGIKFEDAIRYVGALTQAGIPLENVLANNNKLFKDVNMMAITSGVSFEEMAGITGKWATEFRKDTQGISDTFVQLRSDAAESGMTTQRFYENVMNAAQGVSIYRNNVEGVSKAFSGLVKGLRMPQQAAAEITKSLVSLPEEMSASQAALLEQLAGGNHALARGVRKEFDTLIDSAQGLNQTQKNLIKSRQELSDVDLISSEQLDLVRKHNPELAKQIDVLSKALSVKYLEPLSEAKAMIKSMDSGDFMKVLVDSIPTLMPEIFKNVDLGDPKAMAKVFQKAQETINTVTKSLNMSDKQVELIKQEYEKFAENVGKYSNALKSSFGTNEEALSATNQILEELKSGGKGRASAEKKIATIIGRSPDKISEAMEKSFGIKFTKDAKKNAKMVADAMMQSQTGFGDIGKKLQQADIKERKKAANAQADIIEQGTKPIKDQIQETIGYWLREIYVGIMRVYHAVLGKDSDALKAYDQMSKYIHGLDDELKKKKKEVSDINLKLNNENLSDKDRKDLEARRKLLINEQRDIAAKREEYNKDLVTLEEYKDTSGFKGLLRRAGMVVTGEKEKAKRSAEAISSATKMSKGGKTEDVNKNLDKINMVDKAFNEYTKKAFMTAGMSGVDMKTQWDMFKPEFQKNHSNIAPEILGEIEKKYGFGKGGFTGTGPDDQIAGIVHKNEYVVDADTVRKAGLSNLIDQIGSSSSNIQSAAASSKMLGHQGSQSGTMSTLTPMMLLQEMNKSIAGLQAGTVNNNQQVTINVNQRDAVEIEQIVRKVIYHSKEGR